MISDVLYLLEEVNVQIAKDIFQVSGSLNGVTWTGRDASYDDCNVYVVRQASGLIMFDCGCGDTLEQIQRNMQAWEMDLGDVKACFITHSHLDHAGAAHVLKAKGIPLYANKHTNIAISTGDERCCGYLYHKHFTPCNIDFSLEDEQRIEVCGLTITAMHLPGHTAGCTAYAFEKGGKRIVVSGDVIGTLLDGHFGWNGSIDFDKAAYLKSLQRFARYDSDLMLPGHGMVYFHQPRRRVEQAFEQALCQWR